MDLKRITPVEAKQKIEQDGYLLVDVRSMPEYTVEHPAGAYNIPYLHKAPYGMVPNQEFSKVVQQVFPDRDAKIITSCQMGGRSLRAAMELSTLGYTNVIDLRGGFGGERDDGGAVVSPGWKDSGLPTETGDTPARNYRELANKAGAAPAAPEPAAQAHDHGHDHDHHGHDHAHDHHGHSHAAGESCAAPAPPPAKKVNRFADPEKKVFCQKFGKELAAMKRKPFTGPLGDRIKSEISADAWDMWVEHSKMLINEYRLSPLDPKAQEMLMQQCEAYFFGEGARLPAEYTPEARGK